MNDGLTPFNWSARNMFRSPYWYALLIGGIVFSFTLEYMRWLKSLSWLEGNGNLQLLLVLAFWIAGFAVPSAVIWIIRRKK